MTAAPETLLVTAACALAGLLLSISRHFFHCYKHRNRYHRGRLINRLWEKSSLTK